MAGGMKQYWLALKSRFKVLGKATDLSKVIFDTDSTYWCQRSLSDELGEMARLPGMDARLPIQLKFSSPSETIECIKGFKEQWMNHPKEIEIGLKKGHFYSNAKYKGQIVAVWKTAMDEAYIFDYRRVVDIPESVAFSYHMYIFPEFRRQNIAPAMYIYLMLELKHRGFLKIISYYSPWNIRSRNLLAKIGFRDFAYVRHFRILSSLVVWYIRDLNVGRRIVTCDISRLFGLLTSAKVKQRLAQKRG